jgi:hypothetical protein
VLWAYLGLFACVLAVIFGRTIAAVAGHAIRHVSVWISQRGWPA